MSQVNEKAYAEAVKRSGGDSIWQVLDSTPADYARRILENYFSALSAYEQSSGGDEERVAKRICMADMGGDEDISNHSRIAHAWLMKRDKYLDLARAAIAAMPAPSPSKCFECDGELHGPFCPACAAPSPSEELVELGRLSEKATGEWWCSTDGVVWIPTYDSHGEPVQQKVADTGDENDARFIVASVNYVRTALRNAGVKGGE